VDTNFNKTTVFWPGILPDDRNALFSILKTTDPGSFHRTFKQIHSKIPLVASNLPTIYSCLRGWGWWVVGGCVNKSFSFHPNLIYNRLTCCWVWALTIFCPVPHYLFLFCFSNPSMQLFFLTFPSPTCDRRRRLFGNSLEKGRRKNNALGFLYESWIKVLRIFQYADYKNEIYSIPTYFQGQDMINNKQSGGVKVKVRCTDACPGTSLPVHLSE